MNPEIAVKGFFVAMRPHVSSYLSTSSCSVITLGALVGFFSSVGASVVGNLSFR